MLLFRIAPRTGRVLSPTQTRKKDTLAETHNIDVPYYAVAVLI
jgi:hypothetical protein